MIKIALGVGAFIFDDDSANQDALKRPTKVGNSAESLNTALFMDGGGGLYERHAKSIR